MKKLTIILGFLVLLLCPVTAEEESEFYYVEQGTVLVNFGDGATATEANCAGLAVDAVLGLTQMDIHAELTLVRIEAELVLIFSVNGDDTEELNSLMARCPEIHDRSFPTEHLTIYTIDQTGEKVHRLYTSLDVEKEEVEAKEPLSASRG